MARIRKVKDQHESNTKSWKFGKYVRLSKEDLLTGDSRSIISQNMTLDHYLNKLKESGEDIVVIDEYKDDGTSGMYDSRSEFQRAIMDMENERINALIVCDLSRMFRNDADQKHYLEYYFRERKIRIISCNLPQLDTFREPDRVFSMDVKFQGMSNANMPIENSLKIKDKLSNRRKQGLFVGSFAPYGYKKDPQNKNKLVVDAMAAEIVKDIYQWFVYDNISIRRIVEKLNRLGIVNPTEYKRQQGDKFKNAYGINSTLWSEGTVRTILTRQYYIGNMDQHRSKTIFTSDRKKIVRLTAEDLDEDEIVRQTHEAIVSERTHQLAQNLLSRDRRTAPAQTHAYLFSGLLICGDCHRAMIAKKAKNITYYYCSTYLKRSRSACSKHTIREDALQDAVLSAIQLQVARFINVREMIDRILKHEMKNGPISRIKELLIQNQNDLMKQEMIQDNLYVDWKQGDISKEQYDRLNVRIKEKIIHLKKIKDELMLEKERQKLKIEKNNSSLNQIHKCQNVIELDHSLLVELIDKIYIYEDKRIDINFSFADKISRLYRT